MYTNVFHKNSRHTSSLKNSLRSLQSQDEPLTNTDCNALEGAVQRTIRSNLPNFEAKLTLPIQELLLRLTSLADESVICDNSRQTRDSSRRMKKDLIVVKISENKKKDSLRIPDSGISPIETHECTSAHLLNFYLALLISKFL